MNHVNNLDYFIPYILKDDTILELGFNILISNKINSNLFDKNNHLLIEPNYKIWKNIDKLNINVINGFISTKELNFGPFNNSKILYYSIDNIEKQYNLKFNVLIANRELLNFFLEGNKDFYKNLRLIIFEKCHNTCNYIKIINILKENNYKQIKEGKYNIWIKYKICICSAATEDYLERLQILYNSLNKYCNNVMFHAHIINTDKTIINKNYNCEITYSTINTSDSNIIRNYASNIRCKLLNDLISSYDKIYWFDADSIIRKPINNIFIMLNNSNIVIYKSKSNKLKKKWKTGIIGFKNCWISKKIIKKWYVKTFKNSIYNCYWYQDQYLLGKFIQKFLNNGKCTINKLPKTYIDSEFDSESFIWVGKGSRKNKIKYKLEEQKYK